MTSVSICVCGKADKCDRQCAGALAQQQECARRGHLTSVGHDPDPNFCYRCGPLEATDVKAAA